MERFTWCWHLCTLTQTLFTLGTILASPLGLLLVVFPDGARDGADGAFWAHVTNRAFEGFWLFLEYLVVFRTVVTWSLM